ncbi:hypothetical protein Cob_v009178 [Colletotrichum orbiculare MAFF 240422]|uniref:Uncharacterized protein n=1 Tax=Colletotrichum orbiculare (strain 104-T / ATCC 96160 / CBS 514.97 / LARS 414 / MAFF 240422) TaxID=1213857 RepID=A0A484FJX2_COLOR|nr:hypothetical protein Cob_v009178 [Colletotrichum orbiculare MAFF 240422]
MIRGDHQFEANSCLIRTLWRRPRGQLRSTHTCLALVGRLAMDPRHKLHNHGLEGGRPAEAWPMGVRAGGSSAMKRCSMGTLNITDRQTDSRSLR